MSILPWEDWIYNLPYLRDEVNTLHTEAVNKQNLIQSKLLSFNAQVDNYRKLVANNAALLLINAECTMNELDLQRFQADIEKSKPPSNWSGYPAILALDVVLVGVTGISFTAAIYNMSKVGNAFGYRALTRQRIASDASLESESIELAQFQSRGGITDVFAGGLRRRNVGIGEEEIKFEPTDEAITEDTIADITTASSSKLIATGAVGIIVALGIDVIFGAINGAKSKQMLEGILDDLQSKLKTLDSFITQIDNKSNELKIEGVKQMDSFKTVVGSLETIYPAGQKPNFTWNYDSTLENLSQFIGAQENALQYYSLMPQLRTSYTKARERNPTVDKNTIVNAVLLTSPAWVTLKIVEEIWDVMLKYSLASSEWSTSVENRSHWNVSVSSSSSSTMEVKSGSTVKVAYSATGIFINVESLGVIELTDSADIERDRGVPVYGVHVISGDFVDAFVPDLVNNAMYVTIFPDGTFTVRPGVEGIPIGIDENHSAELAERQTINIPSSSAYNFGTGNFSLGAWFLADKAKDFQLLSRKDDTGGFVLGVSADAVIHFSAYEGTTKHEVMSSTPLPLLNGEWHYISAVRSGTQLLLFADGQSLLVSTVGEPVTSALNVNSSSPLVLGSSFEGSFMEVGLWNNALALDDIRKYMFVSCIGTEMDLVGFWSMHSQLNDSTSNHNNGYSSDGSTVAFLPVFHCEYTLEVTMHFVYCAISAIQTTTKIATEVLLSRKQTIAVPEGAPYLYATVSKAGDRGELVFPEGVRLEITDPSGNKFLQETDSESLFVMRHSDSIWCLVVKQPAQGDWTLSVSAPVGVPFRALFQTAPDSAIAETTMNAIANLYHTGQSTKSKRSVGRNLLTVKSWIDVAAEAVIALAGYNNVTITFIIAHTAYLALGRGEGRAVKNLLAFVCAVAYQDAVAFISTFHDIGVIEATKKVLGFARAIPASAGTSTVYVWSYRGVNEAVGHASLSLSDGTHISWWPSKPGDTPIKALPFDELLGLNGILYESPAFPDQTYERDEQYEGVKPDFQIDIKVLDEAAIKAWWATWKTQNKWRTTDSNCSTCVALALKAGGAASILSVREMTQYYGAVNVWTPNLVVDLAYALSRYNP